MSALAEIPTKTPSAMGVILRAGVAAGVLDITAALIVYARFGRLTLRLLQGIASGLLGPAAFQGGLATALLGLGCHFFIATSAAAAYYLASRRALVLIRSALVFGPGYGVVVYFFMQLVVIPLSAIGPRPIAVRDAIVGVIIHILCVGLPIALIVRRFSQ